MKTKDSYSIFINNISKKIDYYSSELHFTISLCSTFNKTILKSNDIRIVEYFSNINFLDKFNIKDINKLNIDAKLYTTIKLYHSYVTYKIPNLIIMLENYIFINSIPYNIYYEIIKLYNTEISKLILKGNAITLSRIGTIKIIHKSKQTNRKILDFKKTKQNKQYFKDNNITGDYRVYNTNDEFSYFSFSSSSINRNLEYYHFEPTEYNNMIDRKIENYYSKVKSEDDILNNIKIGNVQKMNALIKNNYKYKLKYKENAN